jgi:hypothetical protein
MDVAKDLRAQVWRTIRWREGTNAALSFRFAAVRIRPAHRDCHLCRDRWFGGEADILRHMRCCPALGIGGPILRQIELAVDEAMALGHISSEHADLAVGDLARRARVLASDSTRGLDAFRHPLV